MLLAVDEPFQRRFDVPCIQRYCGTPGKTTLLAFLAIIMPVIAHSIGD
jgi:hypothetical protein